MLVDNSCIKNIKNCRHKAKRELATELPLLTGEGRFYQNFSVAKFLDVPQIAVVLVI